MSFSLGVATVVVSLSTSLIAGVILKVIEERSSCVSLWFLALALRFQPEVERDEFLDEALGNLAQLEGHAFRAIGHAVGLVPASVSIGFDVRREQALAAASADGEQTEHKRLDPKGGFDSYFFRWLGMASSILTIGGFVLNAVADTTFADTTFADTTFAGTAVVAVAALVVARVAAGIINRRSGPDS